jgi:hypothetical protein
MFRNRAFFSTSGSVGPFATTVSRAVLSNSFYTDFKTQNHCVTGLRPAYGILIPTKHSVSEIGCFRPQLRG